MRSLSNMDFLNLWEGGAGLGPLDRGLLALGAALPDTPHDTLADWPLGLRNRSLAELQCAVFGRDLQGWVSCPRCAEKLEFQLDGGALALEKPLHCGPVEVGGHSFRLPTSRDVAGVAHETDARAAAVRLIESCRVDPSGPVEWSDADIEEIGECLAAADPLAETRLTLRCAECSHEWEESLDIAGFVWQEVEARANRLLRDIHTLAAAYGWTESEVLRLSEARRGLYLDMVRA